MTETTHVTALGDLWTLCITPLAGATPLWAQWSFPPALVLPFVAMLWLYGAGAPERGRRCALAGFLVLGLALFSPLCRLAAGLVSAHMIQLALISIVAPALMSAGGAHGVMAAGLARLTGRGAPARGATQDRAIAPAAVVYGAAIWAWHAPPIYEASLANPAIHAGVFLAIVAVSIWFFARAAAPQRRGAAIFALLVTMAHTGFIGAILTFAPRPLYPGDPARLAEFGLSAMGDQQLAGLIMWAPAGLLYLVAALALAVSMIEADGRATQAARRGSPRPT
jgi:cytochrome c oxidase assembly factor CtaG